MELRICKPGEAPRLRMAPPQGLRLNEVWVQGSVNIKIKQDAGWTVVEHHLNRALPDSVGAFLPEPADQVGTVTIDGTKGKRPRIGKNG